MPVTYTNRKGVTYFLCKSVTKTGKPRYTFTREPKGELLERIPPGYEIVESVNGVVSLIKVRPRLILPEEITSLEKALKRHPNAQNYRLAVKHDRMIVYEALGPDIEGLEQLAKMMGVKRKEFEDQLQIELERYVQFTPIMQFILDNPQQRLYRAERWCYMENLEGWIYAGHSGKIGILVPLLIPKLGTDDFYQLY
jgi:hypothetical protein